MARLNTFELMARAWHAQAQKDREWSAGYAEKVMRHLELHIFPWLGYVSMDAIEPTEAVRCLHRIKERGNLETAQRVKHVRRLEALRRAGIVQRIADGVWKVQPDLMQKAVQHDVSRASGLAIELQSHLPVHQ